MDGSNLSDRNLGSKVESALDTRSCDRASTVDYAPSEIWDPDGSNFQNEGSSVKKLPEISRNPDTSLQLPPNRICPAMRV